MPRHVIEVKREPGTKAGMKVTNSPSAGWTMIKEILPGAVENHNKQVPSEKPDDVIRPGDRIVRVNGHTGEGMAKQLSKTKTNSLTIEVIRPANGSLVSYVPTWLLGAGTASQIVRSRGLEKWLKSFSYIAGVGTGLWLLSGYPPASLPVYYYGPSAFVAWYTTSCCHNDKPKKQGDPHCFHGSEDTLDKILTKAWQRTTRKRVEAWLNLNF